MATAYTMLLVDDDADDTYFTRVAFGRVCPLVRIEAVADGEEAVRRLEAGPRPDHVLLDLKLPRRSGLDVLRWIRSNPKLADLPVTIASGSDLPSDMAEAMGLGIFGYMRKHVAMPDFLAAIETLCQRMGWSASLP